MTQAERRARTVALILQATIDAIIELGVDGATIREICDRAGVSQGGLFRHFRTRNDVLLAALELVQERQTEAVAAVVAATEDPTDDGWLEALARRADHPENLVRFDLLLAARTDPDLQPRVAQLLAEQDEMLYAAAIVHPVFSRLSDRSRRCWVDILRRVVQGGALNRMIDVDVGTVSERAATLIALFQSLEAADAAGAAGADGT
ncbi:TetR/AcrR family transcriptional regulator [Desertimonas flava]|jgi:AcrR family transcriptional regulator|uniref:TetR/AcrR family transcriptional regulator n=1 Tax=Desertimonas flava TaxID=2064846 RepID=UPI000E3464E3|nr:TetR/AcrR family transcriptional regulator [Desertimonas flava]